MPPLLADFIHNRVCKPICEKLLTLPKFQPARVFFPATGQQIGLPQIRKLTKEWDQHKVFVLIPF